MSRSSPKFKEGDIVQVISNKSKHKGMFGKFRGYTKGLNDHMCRVEIGFDIVFLMENSIKLITEHNIADLHYTEANKAVEEKTMQHERNIEVKYEGKHIRIGVHKLNGNTYMQKIDSDEIKNLWFRFEPEYYLDYEEYIKEYCDYLKKEAIYPDLRYNRILDGETLNHYIAMYNPIEVYINTECVYDSENDIEYCVESYIQDMQNLAKLNFYPFIKSINIEVISNHHFKITFKTTIEHKMR